MSSPDQVVISDEWSDLRQFRPLPDIDIDVMRRYRLGRVREQLEIHDVAMCMLASPVSLRYAIDNRSYMLFMAHIPSAYAFISVDGPVVSHGVYGPQPDVDRIGKARGIAYFDTGDLGVPNAEKLAQDILDYLAEIGTDNRRVAIEYVNPSITQELERRGLEVIDGVNIVERARLIKSPEEIECIRWSIAVAQHGIAKMREVLRPGITEQQLWGVLNYTNLANDGDWHEARMLASGLRTNPWLQEATDKKIEAGELVGFDTDMIGPFGYCADVSRTFFCGPGKPTATQKKLYQLAAAEVEHNLGLVRAGISFSDFQQQSFDTAEEYHKNAYTCLVHGVGLCDEYPQIKPKFRGENPYHGELEAGMVICVESFIGDERGGEGVKIEQQVLVTDDGYELLSDYPLEEDLMS